MVENYMTVYENIPCKVGGFVLYNGAEDFYTIVLNSRDSCERNMKTFEHELKHIQSGDFHGYKTVSLLERTRH